MARPASELHNMPRRELLEVLERYDADVNDVAKILKESVRTVYRVIAEKKLTPELLRIRARVLEKK